MKSLASCIRKAGKAISPSDAEYLKESRQEYLDEGMKASEAADRAVRDYIALVQDEVQSVESEIRAEGGHIPEVSYSLLDDITKQENINREADKRSNKKVNHEAPKKETPKKEEQKKEAPQEDPVKPEKKTKNGNSKITPEKKWYDNQLRYWQDKFINLKRTQESIERNGSISDEANTYDKETLLHGKAELDLDDFKERHLFRLLDRLAEKGLNSETLDLFLYAMHAPERNKYLKEQYEAGNTDPFKMDDNFNIDALSGMSNARAAEILAKIKKEGKYKEYELEAVSVYAMLEHKRKTLSEHGTLSDQEKDSWEGRYKYYVPLKGFASDEDGFTKSVWDIFKSDGAWAAVKSPFQSNKDTVHRIIGKGFAIKGNESMKAMGRRTTAGSILTHVTTDVTSAILRGRKNEVAQSLLKLAEDNKDPHYWSIHTAETPYMRIDVTGNKVAMNEYEMSNSDEFVPVKKKGKQFYIRIKDKEFVAAMKNMNAEELSAVTKTLGTFNRYLSTVSTSLSPEFVVSNFFRDLQTALFNAMGESSRRDGKLINGKKPEDFSLKSLVGGYKGAIAAIYRIERGNPLKGDKWEAIYQEYLESGAKTGFFDSKTIEQQAKSIKRYINMAKGTPTGKFFKYGGAVLDFVNDVNGSVENVTRLIAYKYARDLGLSKQKSAVFAKDLTVNFNRRGELTSGLNATFMFANASIQGSWNFLRSMGSYPVYTDKFTGKRSVKLTGSQGAAIGMVGATFMLSMLSRAIGGEGDDGEDNVDKIPDYVNERNYTLMLPEGMFGDSFIKENPDHFGLIGKRVYFKLPSSYGYNIFGNIGSGLEQVIYGSKRKSKTWYAKYLTFSVLGSFSPVGSANSEEFGTGVGKTLTPTIAKPFVEMWIDENYFGSPVYADRRFIKKATPDSATPKRSTWSGWKSTAQFINEITGGSKYKKGGIDIAPESFEHLAKFASGGLGTFILNMFDAGEKVVNGETPELRKIPFVKKFIGETSAYQTKSDFYNRLDEVLLVRDEWLDLPYSEKSDFRALHTKELNLAAKGKRLKSRLKKINKTIKRLQGKEKLLPFEQDLLERMVKREYELLSDFNLQYNAF